MAEGKNESFRQLWVRVIINWWTISSGTNIYYWCIFITSTVVFLSY